MRLNCHECGQRMPVEKQVVKAPSSVFDVDVLSVLLERDESIYWPSLQVGTVFGSAVFPQGFTATLVARQEDNVDSWGDSVGEGYVVFNLTDGETSHNYRVTVQTDSYSSDIYEFYKLSKVVAAPRTIQVWDEV